MNWYTLSKIKCAFILSLHSHLLFFFDEMYFYIKKEINSEIGKFLLYNDYN